MKANTSLHSPTKLQTKQPRSRGVSPSKKADKHTIHSKARKDYKFRRLIGKGAEGVVYEATRRSDGRRVAIKEVEQHLRSFYSLKQVLREITILRRLSELPGASKHIALLEDLIWVEEAANSKACCFLVMEYAEGVTLKEFLDQAQKKQVLLSTEDAVKLSYNLIKAVEFIHRSGVIHRDIKPANLMVSPDLDVRLIDFGLSRTVNSNSSYDGEPVPKSKDEKKDLAQRLLACRKDRKKRKRGLSPHVQTRIYRAPEVALLENEYSFPADIWSVGCIIAEILQCQSRYQLDIDEPYARYIFKSTSCYPLSPCPDLQGNKEVMDRLEEHDLLKVMLKVLGDQKSYDLSFLTSTSSMNFVHKNFSQEPRVKFEQEFEGTPKRVCKLLEKCLMLNPFFRFSASDLLKLEAFSDLKGGSEEESPSIQINLKFDEAGEYDYDTCRSRSWKEKDLIRLMFEEVRALQALGKS